MNHPLLLPVVALLTAAVVAAVPRAASAADTARAAAPPASPTSPAGSAPRTGAYKVVKRGDKVTHAKCAEGGTVLTPSHEKGGAAQRARDIQSACKNIDYTK